MSLILKQKGLNDEESAAKAQIVPGISLYGFCCGYFGRDWTGEKVVTSVVGNVIHVVEEKYSGPVHMSSFEITSWVDLIKSSNRDLEEMENS